MSNDGSACRAGRSAANATRPYLTPHSAATDQDEESANTTIHFGRGAQLQVVVHAWSPRTHSNISVLGQQLYREWVCPRTRSSVRCLWGEEVFEECVIWFRHVF